MEIRSRNHNQPLRSGRPQICAAVLIALGMILTSCTSTPAAAPASKTSSPPSSTGSQAYIEGFAVSIQGEQHDSWTWNEPGECARYAWGGEDVKITSTEPALLTVFDITSAAGQLAGTVPIKLHLTVKRTAEHTDKQDAVYACPFSTQGYNNCGNRSFDATASLSYNSGRVNLLGDVWGYQPVNTPSYRFNLECLNPADVFGLPLSTWNLRDSDPHQDTTNSGTVSGPLAATQLLNGDGLVPTVTVAGKVAGHFNNGAQDLRRSAEISLKVQLRRLYRIRPWYRYEAPNCAALLDLIDGTDNGTVGHTDYDLLWLVTRSSDTYDRQGNETATEVAHLVIKNGWAAVRLPDWTNVRRPQDVIFWKQYRAEILKHELGHVKVLADFLKDHSRPYVFTATALIGSALDQVQLQEDTKLKELKDELGAAQQRYHDKVGRYVNPRCP